MSSVIFPVVCLLYVVSSLESYVNAQSTPLPRRPPSRKNPSQRPRKRPVRVFLDSGRFTGDNLRIKCVANVTQNVNFNWKRNGITLEESNRIKIITLPHESTLITRKAVITDTGRYECVARYNGRNRNPRIFVQVKPSLLVKFKPKSAIIERGKSILLRCKDCDGNTTGANITWFLKRLPFGPWRQLAGNDERLLWNAPHRLRTPSSVVYDFYCKIEKDAQSVRSSIGRITVIKSGSLSSLGSCPAEVVEGIQWQQTISGMVDKQSCPNATGDARRVCDSFPGRPPTWRRPYLKHCSSPLFRSLVDEIAALDEGFKVNLDVPKTLRELRNLTRIVRRLGRGPGRSARLFGRDLLSSVQILRRTRGLLRKGKDPRKLAKESFLPFTETASNLLDLENKATWEEVDEENPNTPGELVSAIDEFGFELEDSLKESGENVKEAREKNLAFHVRRVSAVRDLERGGLTFRQNDSLINLPTSIFEGRSTEVTVVSVVYDTLSSILSSLNFTHLVYNEHSGAGNVSRNASLLKNSKIIASTVKPLGGKVFDQPVKIVLENTGTSTNATLRRRCVFWKPEEGNRWSDKGCRIVAEETNEYITTCECNHLTLFAVMVDAYGGDQTMHSAVSSSLEIISTVGSAISLAAVILTLVIYVYLWKNLRTPRVINLMNVCVAIGMLDIFSVLRGPYRYEETLCKAMGILLHYFLLALFLWMLCEGILLYLLLAEIFKNEYGKKWYIFVHALGWGLPALIVAISLGIAGPSEYGRAGDCWLSKRNGFIWAALGPMIAVLLANYVVYGVMLYRVLTSHKVQQEDVAGKLKASVRASIIILPILGFTWMFAVLDFFFDQVTFKYLFAIFNSLQGFFIFLFHCLLNNKVQQALFHSRRPERKNFVDGVKTQELRKMKDSQDSQNTLH